MRDTWFDPTAPSRQVSRQRARLAAVGKVDATAIHQSVPPARSGYMPHIGRKQRAKGAARAT